MTSVPPACYCDKVSTITDEDEIPQMCRLTARLRGLPCPSPARAGVYITHRVETAAQACRRSYVRV